MVNQFETRQARKHFVFRDSNSIAQTVVVSHTAQGLDTAVSLVNTGGDICLLDPEQGTHDHLTIPVAHRQQNIITKLRKTIITSFHN